MERNLTNIKERILYFTDIENLSKEKFFKDLGVSYGSFKGKAKYQALSSDVIERILSNYSKINPEWLLIGKGEMLKTDRYQVEDMSQHRKTTDALISDQEVPLYDIEATAGLQNLFDSNQPAEILDTIHIPNLPKCDGAITVTGDSMYPLLKSGDMVLYKVIQTESIFYGEMYLLGIQINGDDEYITVKYVQKSEKEGFVKLVSQNTHHSPKDIPIDSIQAIALIKASIRINTMF